MRAADDGFTQRNLRIRVRFDGEEIEAIEGESIAAALHAAGKKALRLDRGGKGRGIFCGMGVCQECLVVVDGVPSLRACMTPIRAGMAIERQPYAPAMRTARAPESKAGARGTVSPEILVIGAGAAGLAAARTAALAGATVVLVDERPEPGGQFFKQLAKPYAAVTDRADRQMRAGVALIGAARDAGVELVSGATAWGAFSPQEIAIEIGGETRIYSPAQLIIATGAYERAWAIPGWTLPGVMTTGAAQTLLRAYRVLAGRRVLLAGNGPLNLQVAVELRRHGAEIAAVAEIAPAPALAALGPLIAMARHAPDLLRDGIMYRSALARRRVPVLHSHVLTRIDGREQAAEAVLAAVDTQGVPIPGAERRFAVDAVCMGYGFMPQNELARGLGCRHDWDARRGHLAARRDDDMRSNLRSVYICGDCAGLNGARVAQAEGTIAGIAAARALGKPIPAALAQELRKARSNRAKAVAFQDALWRLYRPPASTAWLDRPEDLVCRCEDVDRAEIEAALVPGADIGAIKRATRAGMGRCQGRYCGPAIAAALAAASGMASGERDFFAPRMPAKPVPLAAIARREEQ